MGIPLNSQFDVNAALPLDSRFYFADIASRDALASGKRYEGMIVYVGGTSDKLYHLKGGVTNTDWTELGGGASSVLGPASSVNEAIPRYDGVTGKLIKDSNVTLDDDNFFRSLNGKGFKFEPGDALAQYYFQILMHSYFQTFQGFGSNANTQVGASITLVAPVRKYIRMQGTYTTINGITPGTPITTLGSTNLTEIVLLNETITTYTFTHNTGPAGSQIQFADGKSYKMKPNTSLSLAYHNSINKWIPVGGGGSSSPSVSEITTKTADYTATIDDDVIIVDTTTISILITLPSASSAGAGKKITIKKKIMDDNTVTVVGTIDGFTNFDIGNQNAVVFLSDGTNWMTL